MRIAVVFAVIVCVGFVWFATSKFVDWMQENKENSNSSNTSESNSKTEKQENNEQL